MVKTAVYREPLSTIIVVGGARGVDKEAEKWALHRGMQVEVYEAEWDKYGRTAGFKRNSAMVAVADRGIAFWDGLSPGAKDSIDKFIKAGKDVKIVRFLQK